jgi:hypothetical protein
VSVSNVEKVNLVLGVAGRISSDYSSKWIGTFPDNAQVSVTQSIDTLARFAVNTNIQTAKVSLGDKVSLVRHYNEVSGGTDTLKVGELNGTAGSFIEGGFVGGRKVTYAFGYLNTDAEFAGQIRPYHHPKDSVTNSDLMIHKVGTGRWTLSGNSPDFNGSAVEVVEGTLAIGGVLGTAGENSTYINVRTGATLQSNGATLGAFQTGIYNGATLAGGVTIAGGLYVEPDATIKLHVRNFTDFDVVTVAGDVTFDGDAILDITVDAATAGAKAKLFNVDGSLEGAFAKIFVNGVNITTNKADTPNAKFVWHADTAELEALSTFTGVADVTPQKEIQSIIYYNVSGIQVTEHTPGIQIRKITYTDGTVEAVKTVVKYNK